MTTATAEAPDDEKVHTERELRKQEATLRETREKLAEMREQEEELSDEIADALEAGEDPSDLREEREEIRAWISDMEPVLPVLEERIRDRRLRKLRADAEERLREIKKRCGGLAGEQDRKIERAVEHLEKAHEHLEAAGRASALGEALRSEAALLARAFDLEVPELRRVPTPESYDEITGAGDVRGWLSWKPATAFASYDRMRVGAGRVGSAEDPVAAARELEAIHVPLDSPARELLERLEELE